MCGISGLINKSNFSEEDLKNIMSEMAKSLKHRGPDSSNLWIDEANRLSFAHTRLSILDVSSAGNQPMQVPSGKYVITYNGEIYNHQEIREELNAINKNLIWSSNSDTETLLYAIEEWGIDLTLEKVLGMYAFGLFDKDAMTLILCRDRMGEKPLYYGKVNDSFVFSSELKGIKCLPRFSNKISNSAVSIFCELNYIPAPLSIYEEIFKLLPGHYLKIKIDTLQSSIHKYWSFHDEAIHADEFKILDEADAESQLEEALEKSVKSQLISDVPIGAFLSGGIDSSLIVALMQKFSEKPIKTFTIGFDDKNYDESQFAQLIADYLKTDHYVMNLSAQDAIELIKIMPTIYDEPFADSSQIPTTLVSRSAKNNVTVALSGDGGDELFGGYNRYLWVPKIWKIVKLLPNFIVNFTSKLILYFSISTWDKLLSLFPVNRPGEKLHKLAYAISDVESGEDIYINLIKFWHNPTLLLRNPVLLKETDLSKNLQNISSNDLINKMMIFDAVTYLPDDILTKVDRAAMSQSLETRAPFLDKNIVELSLRIDQSIKIKKGSSKNILRNILKKYIPEKYFNRPKVGFSLPIGDWLRGPLKAWAESLLDPKIIDHDMIFLPQLINKIWLEHLSGDFDHSSKLWSILMFQAWLQHEKNSLGDQKSYD